MVDPIRSLRRIGKGRGRPNLHAKFGPNLALRGNIANPEGKGGQPKGGKSRNIGASLALKKGSARVRAMQLKATLVRTGEMAKTTSRGYVRKEHAKSVAMEARELQEMAKKSMPAVMDRIYEIVTDRKSQDHHAIAAGVFLADRAYGKAIQPSVNATVDNNGKTSEIDDAELTNRIRETIDRVTRITSGAGKKVKGKK